MIYIIFQRTKISECHLKENFLFKYLNVNFIKVKYFSFCLNFPRYEFLKFTGGWQKSQAKKRACDYWWPLWTDPKIRLWLLVTTFDGPENLLVTIDDHSACDYYHPQVYLKIVLKIKYEKNSELKNRVFSFFLIHEFLKIEILHD